MDWLKTVIPFVAVAIISGTFVWFWQENRKVTVISDPPIVEDRRVENTNKLDTVHELSFASERIGSRTKLSVLVPEGQSACVWNETSTDYATGANIFTTESTQANGNSKIYETGFNGTVAATCRDKYGGEYQVKLLELGRLQSQ